MIIKVLLNETSMFKPYGENDELTLAATSAICDTHAEEAGGVLDLLFEELNVDEPRTEFGQAYRQARNRSLSVGDVIVLGEVAYACEPGPWRIVTVRAEQITNEKEQ